MKLASLSNEELVARLHAGDATPQGVCDTYNEIRARLLDGRAVLAGAHETLSIDCNACGNTVDFRIDGVDVY